MNYGRQSRYVSRSHWVVAPKNLSHSSFLYQWNILYISSGIADCITLSSAILVYASPKLKGNFLTSLPAFWAS